MVYIYVLNTQNLIVLSRCESDEPEYTLPTDVYNYYIRPRLYLLVWQEDDQDWSSGGTLRMRLTDPAPTSASAPFFVIVLFSAGPQKMLSLWFHYFSESGN